MAEPIEAARARLATIYSPPRAEGTKDLLVQTLQERGHCTASELATRCGVTDAAMRQHLEHLERAGVVVRSEGSDPSQHRGRPPISWSLAPSESFEANFPSLFPDRHGELAAEVLNAVAAELGAESVDAVLRRRISLQVAGYRRALREIPSSDLRERVRRLARLRDGEGYRAEAVENDDGSFLLIEHHCPIGDAATACNAFCDAERTAFADTLGSNVIVERTAHALRGDGRCVHRISLRRPRRPASPE